MPRRTLTHALAIAAAVPALAFPATAAHAATIDGTPRGERLVGTMQADAIRAFDGADRVLARAGDDTVDGARGADLLRGGAGSDTLDGGAGPDVVRGSTGDDAIQGGAGRDFLSAGFDDDRVEGGAGGDRIFANQGVDTISGGDGDDDLWALSRKDVTGPGDVVGDTLDGGAGNDRFHTYDGEADRITCGDGRDRVIADVHDVIADATPENPNGSCERVTRTQPESDRQESAAGRARLRAQPGGRTNASASRAS